MFEKFLNTFFKVEYTWRNKDTDIPVQFIKIAGHSNGKSYAQVFYDGQISYVPADELVRKIKYL